MYLLKEGHRFDTRLCSMSSPLCLCYHLLCPVTVLCAVNMSNACRLSNEGVHLSLWFYNSWKNRWTMCHENKCIYSWTSKQTLAGVCIQMAALKRTWSQSCLRSGAPWGKPSRYLAKDKNCSRTALVMWTRDDCTKEKVVKVEVIIFPQKLFN